MSTKSKQFNLADFYSRYGIFLLFVVMFLLMSITNKNFLTGVNITNISKQIVVITILACGEQLMVIAGLIDLSVGSVLALSGCVAAAVVTTTGSAPLAVAAGLFVGLISGAVNGGILVLFEIPPFITTLATMMIARGAVFVFTGGVPISQLGDAFCWIGQGYAGPIPVPVIIMVLALILTWIILNQTRTGRYIYAVGGNEDAANASGVNIRFIKFFSCAFSGFMAGLSGVLLMARMNSGQPIAGETYEMDAITAVIVGGTSMSGGIGNIPGTIIGSCIIGIIKNFMNLQNINSYWQKIVQGIIVCAAVIIDVRVRKSKAKA